MRLARATEQMPPLAARSSDYAQRRRRSRARLDKCTLGNPAKYSYCVCENEEHSPFAPYHVEHGYRPDQSTVFAIAAEAPHSVTDHLATILKVFWTRYARP